MNDTDIGQFVWTPELLKRRRQRALIMAIILLIWVAMFFGVTLVRLSNNIAANPTLQANPTLEKSQ
ncbi:MAG: hypothetical protein ACR2OT_00320 [Parvibaculales bacterium]